MTLASRFYPQYFTYNDRPVVLLEVPGGGLTCLAVNPRVGDFVHALWYIGELDFNKDADIEELSFEEFVAAVELYRARHGLGEGTVKALYETIRGLDEAAKEQGRWWLNREEMALVRSLSKKTNPLFDQALRERGLTPTPPPVPVELRMARLFDTTDPVPAVDRPAVPDHGVEPLLRYLEQAPMVLAARGYDTDVLDPERPAEVPLTYHTNGRWVWPGAVAYYLRVHGIPPEPDLVGYARSNHFRFREVDEETRRRAVETINRLDSP